MINDTDGRIFANNQNLKEVYLPDGMSQLGQAAFENCTGLTTVVFGEGGMDGMTMESNPLYWSLFPGCTNLQTVDLSRTDLRKVGPSMFENLMNLTTAELPDTVTAVEDDAFLFCESLKKVDISNVQSIGYRSFMGCDNLESISPTGELPQIRWIGEAAFARCKSLSGSLIFGPDLSGIGKGAVNATQLTVIDMSQVKNVNIEIGAFSGNDYLERFILPMNGENLSYMLDGCDIDCLVLPDGADPRFWYSFSASRIGVLICEGSVPSERARKGFAGDYPIVVPVDSVDAYKAAWPEYAHRIVAAELLVKPLESDFGSFYEGKTICIMERGNEKCQPKNENTQRRRVTMRLSRRGQCGWSPSRGGPAGRWPRNSASASTRCAAG